jgi:hypothetical protein
MRIVVPHFAAAAVVVALALPALAGCESAPAPAPATTTSTGAPVFASDEEALAAATEAYAAYLSMSDRILIDGGNDPDRIRKFVSNDLAQVELEGYADVRSKGYHSTGGSGVSNIALQSVNESARDGVGIVSVYLCSDVSAVDVVDGTGMSVVSPTRPDKTPFEVTFDLVTRDPVRLIVASSDVWNGGNVCD